MDGRPYENYYTTQTQQRRMQSPGPLARPVNSLLAGFDGEHLAMCLVSAVVIYGAGYIIARLFYSGIMFFLAVGLIIFFVMQIVDGVDRSVRDYNKVY